MKKTITEFTTAELLEEYGKRIGATIVEETKTTIFFYDKCKLIKKFEKPVKEQE